MDLVFNCPQTDNRNDGYIGQCVLRVDFMRLAKWRPTSSSNSLILALILEPCMCRQGKKEAKTEL